MGRTPVQIKKQTEEWLDERFMICDMNGGGQADVVYYNGAIKAVEMLGWSWTRDSSGKHKIFRDN